MNLEDIVKSMKGTFKKDTVVDFVQLTKLFGEPRYQLLIRKVLDLESRILIAAAKNGELYQNVMRWAEKRGVARRSTIADRKQYLLQLGVISEESLGSNGLRGRPKLRLTMDDRNRERFNELFGESLR